MAHLDVNFNGKREFRAILFQAANLSSPSDVMKLLPKEWSSGRELNDLSVRQGPADRKPKGEAFHGFLSLSKTYVTDENVLESIRDPEDDARYWYDFYIVQWNRRRRPVFLLAVPFSAMAVDVFSVIHEKTKGTRRTFKRIKLDELIKHMYVDTLESSTVHASSVRFRVVGDGRTTGLTISGKDVIRSDSYDRLKSSLHGIQVDPRRVSLKYKDTSVSLSVSTDVHGNLWFRARDNGVNVPWLLEFLSVMDQCKVLTDTTDYPLRRGIKDMAAEDG
jgi:hypothetical protein